MFKVNGDGELSEKEKEKWNTLEWYVNNTVHTVTGGSGDYHTRWAEEKRLLSISVTRPL